MPLTNLCTKDVAQEAQAASTEMLELRQDGGLNMDVRTQSANPASAGFSFACEKVAGQPANRAGSSLRNYLSCLAVLLSGALTAGRAESLEQAHGLRVFASLPLWVPLHAESELRHLRHVDGFDHAVFGVR